MAKDNAMGWPKLNALIRTPFGLVAGLAVGASIATLLAMYASAGKADVVDLLSKLIGPMIGSAVAAFVAYAIIDHKDERELRAYTSALAGDLVALVVPLQVLRTAFTLADRTELETSAELIVVQAVFKDRAADVMDEYESFDRRLPPGLRYELRSLRRMVRTLCATELHEGQVLWQPFCDDTRDHAQAVEDRLNSCVAKLAAV